MVDKEFQVAFSALDDCRRLIAAGKTQRWDVFKWGVALNIGLATAAAAIAPGIVLWLLALMATFGCWRLVRHYNDRMTGARKTATALVKWMKANGVDYEAILGEEVTRKYSDPNYDRQELRIFRIVLVVSSFLPLFTWVWKTVAA
jgi:hypothetical protein